MAIKEYHKVDLETGIRLDVCLFDDEIDIIPDDCKLGWGSGLYNPIFNFELNDWSEGLSQEEIDIKIGRDLATLKANKDVELNQACKKDILAGFTHIINGDTYWFSYDMEAQGNFRDAKEMLSDGIVTEIPWTVRLGGVNGEYARIPITLDIMKALSLVIMQHKTENISKYRDFLMPIVNGATTPEEVEAITWSGDTSGTSLYQSTN